MFFEPQSQFFSTFGFEEVEGQTNEELDRMPFENKEVVMTVDPVPGVVSLGYHYVDFKTDTLNWIIKATIVNYVCAMACSRRMYWPSLNSWKNSKYRKRYVSFSVLNRL